MKDYQPPRWPDAAHPQQFRLDFGVQDLDQVQKQVFDLGATLLDDGGDAHSWRVYANPAADPFCLVRD